MAQHIIAIGGGGFGADLDNLLLDQYVLDVADTKRPKVCFLPQASAESHEYVTRFYEAFIKLGAEPSWLSLFGTVRPDWQDHLLAQDVIYVGSGNTRSMIALWREWGVDDILKQACANGTVLAGVSAGAICWFEQGLTDSVSPLSIIPCLGFLAGSASPHYDAEVDRRPTYLEKIASGEALPGIALYDNVAAHYKNGDLKQVVTARSSARAFHITANVGIAHERDIETVYLGA